MQNLFGSKWKFELTVFELTVSDLYLLNNLHIDLCMELISNLHL